MSLLIINEQKNTKPFFRLRIDFETLNINNNKSVEKYEYIFQETEIEENFKEFMELIKFIYVYYYTYPDTKEKIEDFFHIRNICHFVNYYSIHCACNNVHLSKFALDFPEGGTTYCCPIKYFAIEYINGFVHNVFIKFSEEDINDIVDGIKYSCTVKYAKCNEMLCSNDPIIFMDTCNNLINNKTIFDNTYSAYNYD